MSRLAPGDAAPPFTLQAADGSTFYASGLAGKRWLLSLHRYAT